MQTPTAARRKRRIGWLPVVLLLLVAVGFGATFPVGPREPDEGRIVAVRRIVRGSVVAEFVSNHDGRVGRAPLHQGHGCRVGDVIRLERWRRVWGLGFQPVGEPPCSRPSTVATL